MDGSRIARGERVQRLQTELFGEGDTNPKMLEALRKIAEDYALPVKWEATRLSKIRQGTQMPSIDDLAAFVLLARQRGKDAELMDWYFLAFGERLPQRKGDPQFGSRATDPRPNATPISGESRSAETGKRKRA